MYNLSIPGQVSEFQLKAIELVAELVPKNGKVVEVGSLFGRSSYAWAKSVHETVKVYCIDPWEKNEGVASMERALGIRYGVEQFQTYTADCENIVVCKGYSPDGFSDWTEKIDIYYEDAVHTNPVLGRNIEFWSEHLCDNGVACGDDYRPRFPDVVCEVQALAQRLGRELLVVDYFWCLLPCSAEVPAARAVVKALKDLQFECQRADRQNPTAHTLEVLNIPEQMERGESIKLSFRLTNDSRESWEPWLKGHRIVVSIEGVDDDSQRFELGNLVVEPILFPPDIGREFTLNVGVTELVPRGNYKVSAVISTPRSGVLQSGRLGLNRKTVTVI